MRQLGVIFAVVLALLVAGAAGVALKVGRFMAAPVMVAETGSTF